MATPSLVFATGFETQTLVVTPTGSITGTTSPTFTTGRQQGPSKAFIANGTRLVITSTGGTASRLISGWFNTTILNTNQRLAVALGLNTNANILSCGLSYNASGGITLTLNSGASLLASLALPTPIVGGVWYFLYLVLDASGGAGAVKVYGGCAGASITYTGAITLPQSNNVGHIPNNQTGGGTNTLYDDIYYAEFATGAPPTPADVVILSARKPIITGAGLYNDWTNGVPGLQGTGLATAQGIPLKQSVIFPPTSLLSPGFVSPGNFYGYNANVTLYKSAPIGNRVVYLGHIISGIEVSNLVVQNIITVPFNRQWGYQNLQSVSMGVGLITYGVYDTMQLQIQSAYA